ncbi:OLC1v1039236C2 [Oldenlandia corymbosa var. corymbosa]|uniref:OLC1v1039236C2 n=1 Tax=Oldenlandia corymbosa var. corymbosa TaxID=529605 RepID=A0AAV1D3W0_OLDCO|nr:OLC1v1039236C2 [Oldenlandia corymbosa var. corymbosa]
MGTYFAVLNKRIFLYDCFCCWASLTQVGIMITEMRIVMDLYKVIGETSSVEMQDGQKNQSHTKPPEKPQSFFAGNISQKQQPEFGLPEGTHVVGGSAFGWNFVTFPESKVTYYGRTKESFRLANPKTQVDDS